jgi:hypothetical protein
MFNLLFINIYFHNNIYYYFWMYTKRHLKYVCSISRESFRNTNLSFCRDPITKRLHEHTLGEQLHITVRKSPYEDDLISCHQNKRLKYTEKIIKLIRLLIHYRTTTTASFKNSYIRSKLRRMDSSTTRGW